jgi:glycosidase
MKSVYAFLFFFMPVLVYGQDYKTVESKLTVMPSMSARIFNSDRLAASGELSNATIYEVNIRQYTPSGNILDFTKHIPRLASMGIKILWIMPVQPIGEKNRKGSMGSYYSIRDYMAVNPEMGTMEDFIFMVKVAHENGMKVILDWVANHTAFDHAWIKSNPEFYNRDEKGAIKPPVDDWTDVADLNYDNMNLRKRMADCMKFWLRAADIDGFRCDVAEMVPLDFWQNIRPELETIKPVFMLAEGEKADLHNGAFDMTYSFSQHHIMNDIAKGKKNALALDEYLKGQSDYPSSAYRMYFTTSHDENSWSGSEYERMGEGAKTFAVLTFGMSGMPMIYSGQEAALNKRLKFFEKDPIDWGNYSMADFYTRLINLKKQESALQHGNEAGEFIKLSSGKNDCVYAFVRKKDNSRVLFILNLSGKKQKIKLNAPEIAGEATEIFSGEKIISKPAGALTLNPWQYLVYRYNNF